MTYFFIVTLLIIYYNMLHVVSCMHIILRHHVCICLLYIIWRDILYAASQRHEVTNSHAADSNFSDPGDCLIFIVVTIFFFFFFCVLGVKVALPLSIHVAITPGVLLRLSLDENKVNFVLSINDMHVMLDWSSWQSSNTKIRKKCLVSVACLLLRHE